MKKRIITSVIITVIFALIIVTSSFIALVNISTINDAKETLALYNSILAKEETFSEVDLSLYKFKGNLVRFTVINKDGDVTFDNEVSGLDNHNNRPEIIDAFDDLVNYFKEHKLFDAYYQELEYLAVLHIFILASVRVLKANRKHPLLKIFRSYVKENFPNYKQNPYLNRLTKKERIILKFLDSGNFMALDALLKIRNII